MAEREKSFEVEESPRKKRKVTSGLSKISDPTSRPTASSTPRPSILYDLSNLDEPSDIVLQQPRARKSLTFHRIEPKENLNNKENKENKNKNNERTLLDFLDSSVTSLAESTISQWDDELDYDEFFLRCRRIVLKGAVWALYKPIGHKASLYYQITTDPRNAEDLAKWFADYSKSKPTYVGYIFLLQFYFDCAGYQKYNIQNGNDFNFPINVNTVIGKLNDEDFTDSMLTTTKFLFAENSCLGTILKYAIYNFIQKFILRSEDLLGGIMLTSCVQLLTTICKECQFIPLVYTAYVFVMKILTALCMLKQNMTRTNENMVKVDNFITKLYMTFMSMRSLNDFRFISLKTAGLNELKIWIRYFPNIFLNHFNCLEFFKYLLINESRIVRLATLDFCMKIIQSDELIGRMSSVNISELGRKIWSRTSDTDESVALKAFEIYNQMVKSFPQQVTDDGINEKLIQTLFHKDFRKGSAAGKCVYQLLINENRAANTRLKMYCKIASSFYPKLKGILVESLIDHDPILQDWNLYVHILINPDENDFPISKLLILMELALEAAHVSLTGCTSTKRLNSKTMRSIHYANNDLLANAFYDNLDQIGALHGKNSDIMANILKILMKVSPDYLKEEHCKVASELLDKLITRLFMHQEKTKTLVALLDYLLYMSKNMGVEASDDAKGSIDILKDDICQKFNDSQDELDLKKYAQKLAVLFSKVDLTEKIEWTKLLNSWQVLNTDAEFVDNILIACHWNLIWKIKNVLKLSLGRMEKTQIDQRISAMKKQCSQYFSVCAEAFKSEDEDVALKAFERICESYIKFATEIDTLCKQSRDFEAMKPTMIDDIVSRTEIFKYFEQNIEASVDDDDVRDRFRKYIINIYQMASMEIIPMDSISIIFKYYEKYYNQFGKVIETILTNIFKNNDTWLPLLMVNSLSLLYEDLLQKYGVVDYSSEEAKQISRLSVRFHDYRKIFKGPKAAAMLLIFGVNYAALNKYYDFLIYLRKFIEDVHNSPADVESILNTVRDRVPQSDIKNDAVLYFVEQLKQPAKKTTSIKKVFPRKAPQNPKIKPQTREPKKPKTTKPKSALNPKSKAKLSQQSNETEVSDNMSIHDTSDDLGISDLE